MQARLCLHPLGLVVLGSLAVMAVGHAMEDKPPQTAQMVHYSGEVQGVGFRQGTSTIAKKYAVTGWVKNLKDGRVQLLVEGPEDEVKQFLKAVREHWKKNIDKEESKQREPTGKYKAFEVTIE